MDAAEYQTSIKRISLQRYIVAVFASVLIMACSGAVYAWSIFVSPLRSEYGLSGTQTQVIFGFIIAVFTVTMLFVARIERAHGPRLTAVIGAVLFSAGYLVASFSGGSFILLLAGISFLSGAGMAFGYVTVLTTLVKCFPNNKGLATGIAVSGFGGGAILLSQIAGPLLAHGMAVLDIFRMVGIIYGILFLLGAMMISAPAGSKTEEMEAKVDVRELLKDRKFWVLFYVFFAGSFAGLLFIGSLKPIGLSYGVSGSIAVLGISLLSAGNALGRVGWGQIHDMMGGKRSIVTALTMLSLFTLLLMTARNDVSFPVLALLVGLSFGANFVLYAAEVTHFYGVQKLGTIYPIVSLAYGIAGIVGPIVGGLISDATGNYYIAIIIAAVICASGAGVYALMSPGKERLPSPKPSRTAVVAPIIEPAGK